MSDYAQHFIDHLGRLESQNRAAMAVLRRSLAFEPGAYVPAMPYVERFVNPAWSAQDARRRALYIVAGLFAMNPRRSERSLACALGRLRRQEERESLEKRFIALLGADPENLHTYLRQVVGLLAANESGLDYVRLWKDVSPWINSRLDPDRRNDIRQRWARDFYRESAAELGRDSVSEPQNETSPSNNIATA